MQTPGLDEVTRRVNGGGASAGIRLTAEVALDRIARHMTAERAHRRDFLRAVHAINFPPVLFPVVAGALVTPTQISQLGPEDGYLWDVRRVTLAGWSTADAAINVNLFREMNSPTAGNPQNRLRKFNDSAPGNETWGPGGGLILHAPDAVLLAASGFTTTTGIYLTVEGVQIDDDYEAEYLI